MCHTVVRSPKLCQAPIHLSGASSLKEAATLLFYVEGGDAVSNNSNPTQENLMSPHLTGRKALVLSDNDGLARAIEAHISHCLDVEVVRMDMTGQMEDEGKLADFDLMVVALSSPTREPAEVLTETRLAERVGQIPLLVISDRPFEPMSGGQIIHLSLPFDVDEFHDKLRELLGIA
jgi:hypothetical protein